MALIIERDPVLFVKNYYDMTRPEARQKYGTFMHTSHHTTA
jgi:hypothetical protein